jgi:hypothetical protein
MCTCVCVVCCFCFCFVFWNRISLWTQSWPQTCDPPLPPKCWDYRQAPPPPV